MSRFWRLSLRVLALALLLVVGVAPSPAAAQTARPAFAPNSTADAADDAPGDGVCHTAANTCTLRAAVMETNALPGPDTIRLSAATYTLTIPRALWPADEDAAARDDLDIRDALTVTGAGQTSTIVDGGRVDRVFHVIGTPTVVISGLTVQNGWTVYSNGGGIYNTAGRLTLANVTLRANETTDNAGGGLWTGGQTTLRRVTVTANKGREVGGGGVYVHSTGSLSLQESALSDNRALAGGGLYVCGATTVTRSTISGSQAIDGAGVFVGCGASLTLDNSTVSGNTASGEGGGLRVSGSASLTNTTVAANSGGSGGGLFVGTPGAAALRNTIVAFRQAGGDCAGARPTLIGTGHNLDGDGTCGFPSNGNNWPNRDPKLGPLANNGGPTLTHGFVAASPAIDSGESTGCPSVDQRGSPRPRDGNGNGTALCDIGAFEQQTALR